MKNSHMFFACCLILFLFSHALAQSQLSAEEGEAWMQQVRDSLGKTFGDLNRRPIGPGGGTTISGDGKDENGGTGPNAAGGGGVGAGGLESSGSNDGNLDSSKLDPNRPDIAVLISQWISSAEPPSNATHGNDYKFEQWGRFTGTSVDGGIASIKGKPVDVGGRTSQEYLWSLRDKRDSVNHCKLGEYVLAKLHGKDILKCQGRYGPIVPKLTGWPIQRAIQRLSKLKLKSELKVGSPAPNNNLSATVQSHEPQQGTSLKSGDTVNLIIYSNFVAMAKIPPILGKQAGRAKVILEAAGFKPKIEIGDVAPQKSLSGAVQSSSPKSGSTAAKGASVKVVVYSNFVESGTEKIEGTVPTAEVNGVHTCENQNIPETANWRFFYAAKYNSLLYFPEKKGLICWNSVRRYRTYTGSKINNFRCDNGWGNCIIEGFNNIKNVIKKGNVTTYHFREGGYAVRTAKNGAAALPTNVGGGNGKGGNNGDSNNDALVAAKVCSNANLKSGREWRFPWSLGFTSYYEHSGHLCTKNGEKVMKLLEGGKKVRGYSCVAKWKSCARAKTYDGDIIYSSKELKWDGRLWLKMQIKWSGPSGTREVYIAK